MNNLKEAFLSFISGLAENLAGSLDMGLNSTSQYNDRIDFLLAYILIAFNANYGAREFQMCQVQYEQ